MIDRLFDDEIKSLVERYSVSWYSDIDMIPADRCGTPAKTDRAEGPGLVAAMRANVEEARDNRDGIRARYERAQREGLFDIQRAEDTSPETREKWLAAVEVMKGDKVRCIAELRHWREYLSWAMDAERAAAPDPRLPPEAEAAE